MAERFLPPPDAGLAASRPRTRTSNVMLQRPSPPGQAPIAADVAVKTRGYGAGDDVDYDEK